MAIITSGFNKSLSNWFSISLPPVIKTIVKSVNFAIALKYIAVWIAISLVGLRMTALAPTILEWHYSFSTSGIINAPVFPLPVLAIAITLKPCRI